MSDLPHETLHEGPTVLLYRTGTDHLAATFQLEVGGKANLKIWDHAYETQTTLIGRGVWSEATRESVLPIDGVKFLKAIAAALPATDDADYGLYAVFVEDGSVIRAPREYVNFAGQPRTQRA